LLDEEISMMRTAEKIFVFCVMILAMLVLPAMASTIGGAQGWYKVYCNVDGASVYFDGQYMGVITGGSLTVPVYSTGAPYSSYSVSKDGYTTYSGQISDYPTQGETVDLYATLNIITPTTVATPIGGAQGWYKVYCNVDGASVYFDGQYIGVITGGSLTVPVYSTGTPYSSYSVSKDGYTTYSGQISDYPTQGETVDLRATLNIITPTTVATPIGGAQGWYKVYCNVDGASVYFDGQYMSVITGGSLTVPVYSTGTPYSSYSVSKDGYSTYTGKISDHPTQGETVDLYATLNSITPTTVATPMGGGQGWYKVYCNVDGAQVTFDEKVMGVISQGSLSVPVYVTGTPYKTLSVSAPGYIPYTSAVSQVPGTGETVSLYATLNPRQTTVPATTKAALPPGLAGAAVLIAAFGLAVSCRKVH
jgi:hypothetical protein